jgi:hypothetical protein
MDAAVISHSTDQIQICGFLVGRHQSQPPIVCSAESIDIKIVDSDDDKDSCAEISPRLPMIQISVGAIINKNPGAAKTAAGGKRLDAP